MITITIVSPTYAANILAVLPHQGLSHHLTYLPLFQELATRGHNITMISNYPSEHPKIMDISINGSVPITNNKVNFSFVAPKLTNNINLSIKIMWSFYTKGKLYESMFTVNEVKQLLKSSSEFDLLITEHFNHELSLAFAFKFHIPFILMSSCNLLPWNEHVVGQPYSLAIKPVTLTNFSPKMAFSDRVMNVISNFIQILSYTYVIRKRDEEIIKKNLNMDVSLDQLVLNASLIFVNTHFTMFEPKPFVSSIVEIGGIHIKPIQDLPVVSV